MSFQQEITLKQNSQIALKAPLTIEALLDLMTQRWNTQQYGNFRLEKVLGMKSIRLDDYAVLRFEIQSTGVLGQGKNMMVCINTTEPSNSNKARRDMIKAFGGYTAAREAALQHWAQLLAMLRYVLGDLVK